MICHLAGMQGSCLQSPGHGCQELWVHTTGVQSLPSPCRVRALVQGQDSRSGTQDFKSVTQQPSLTLEGGTTGPSMPGPRSGSKVGRDRESRCLRINGFFYFYRCLCQWAEGAWGGSRILLVPAASLPWGKAASKSNSIWKAKLPENTVGAALRTGGNKYRGEARPTEPTTA